MNKKFVYQVGNNKKVIHLLVYHTNIEHTLTHGYGTLEVQELRVIHTTAGEWGKPTHLKVKVKKI